MGSQNGAKIEPVSKNHSKIDIAIELRFFIDFWSPRVSKIEAPNPTFPSKIVCFAVWERKPTFLTRGGFWIDFGAHLAPFWHHFGRKMEENQENIEPEPASKNNRFLIVFLIDFWTILAPFWTSFSPGRPPKIEENRSPAPSGSFWPHRGHFVPVWGSSWPVWAPF